MKRSVKLISACSALLIALTLLCGCNKSGPVPEEVVSPAPIVTRDPAKTPDPDQYKPDAEGRIADDILSMQLPKYLKFDSITMNNVATYSGTPEGGSKIIFTYTIDDGGIYADELAGYDFDSYQEYIRENINEFFVLKEFSYTEIDGHEVLRAAYDYAPPDEPSHYTYVLQYSFNVNGWIVGFAFTSLKDLPAECDDCIRTVKFNEGY